MIKTLLTGKRTQKAILIIAGLVLLLYVTAFRSGLNQIHEIRQMRSELKELEHLPLKVNDLKKELALYHDFILDSHELESKQQLLFDRLTHHSEQVKLQIGDFKTEDEQDMDQYRISTFSVSASGSFHQLVKYTYALEQDKLLGNLSSAEFTLIKKKKASDKLELKLYFQYVIE